MALYEHRHSVVIVKSSILLTAPLLLFFLTASLCAVSAHTTMPHQPQKHIGGLADEAASIYQSRVMELIDYSLGFYMDELVLWDQPTVTFRHPAPQQFDHLNQIVVQALELYAHPAKESFWGFSGRIEKQLLQLHQLEGYVIDYSNPVAQAQSTISQRELRNRVEGLKTSATHEVETLIEEHPDPIDTDGQLLFTHAVALPDENRMLQRLDKASKMDVALLIDSLFELKEVPHGLIGKINDRIQQLEHGDEEEETDKFHKNQPLNPIPHQLEPSLEADMAELNLKLPKKKKVTPAPSKPVDFNTKVVELLEENNRLMAKFSDRFELMQQQIIGLHDEQRTELLHSEKRLQAQIDDLYEKVENGYSSTSKTKGAATSIIFERNSAAVGLYYQTLLNEMASTLIKDPQRKVMITGFADATGNREYNILLSRRRAESVRNYLQNKGIDESRLVVNYLGDNKSDAANPLDRKVEIEWVK